MPQMMKALVKREAGKGIWMEQVPVPQVGPNDVLIKLEKTAICGTDLHIYKWDEWSQRVIKPGLVIGHEFVGRIVDMGPGVRGYRTGQRVSAEGHIVCGVCRNCRAGRQHLCPHTVGIGVNRAGAFAEFIAMPASNLSPATRSMRMLRGGGSAPTGVDTAGCSAVANLSCVRLILPSGVTTTRAYALFTATSATERFSGARADQSKAIPCRRTESHTSRSSRLPVS